jgi:hypothetical protein
MKTTLSIFLLLIFTLNANAQNVYGCTDPQANNFNSDATINDGSCTYNPTIYKPDFRFFLHDEVEETSGLISWANGYWTHNDSGGEAVIYKLDTLSGDVVQRISLSDATNIDWEDIAQDDDYIYVGDFGNNSGNRDDLAIYIIRKSDIPDSLDAVVAAEKITFSYPDYPGTISKKKENNFDCEALIASGDNLYLFSKNRGDNKSKLYSLPKLQGDYTADLLQTFNSSGLVSGADLSENGKQLVLVGYTNHTWIPFIWLMFDFEGQDFFSGNKRRIDMLNLPATQTEGICFIKGEKGIISSESNPLFSPTVYDFSTTRWTGENASAMEETGLAAFSFKVYPNPLNKKKLTLLFTKLPADNYQVSIFDSMGIMMKMKKYKVDKKEDSYRIKMNLKHLKPGLYFVRVSGNAGTLEKKFIKE